MLDGFWVPASVGSSNSSGSSLSSVIGSGIFDVFDVVLGDGLRL